MRAMWTGFGVGLVLLAGAAQAVERGRLPSDVVPTAYDLTVDPDAAKLTFTGQGSVAIDVVRPTRTITLNAADLTIADVKLDGTVPAATIATDAAAQTATFTFARPLTKGRHSLSMRWSGKIYQSATGLFAIDYTNIDGTPDRMLATQFQAPDARRFAPMWDEPALKATFKLSAYAPTGQTAYSNMPVTAKVDVPGGKTLYRFGPTPKMSSYLLFLGMGNVERRAVKEGNVEIGVITRRGVADQGDYALASARRLLREFNDYYGVPYPLPKMDMIAGPGASQFFGAMENWGAIFYFERVLLLDPKLATENQKQDVFNTVAHEMAHQWFGNLVTMRWWDDLWLNEGFASWAATKASDDLNPEWGARTQNVAFGKQGAFSLDARATTHPIIQPVETVDQISQAFDAITYRKGEAVIRMLEGAVGPDAFRAGVRRYMAKHQYGSTVTDQLWAEIGAASGTDVKPMMDSFTRQGGVPLIRVAEPVCTDGRTVTQLTQGRYGLDAASKAPLRWLVPVNAGVVGGGTVKTTLRAPVGQPNGLVVDGCGPLVVNKGQSAYFRTLYAPAHFDRLRAAFATLPEEDQVGLVGDSYGLASSADQPLDRYLALVDGIAPDAPPVLWSTIASQMTGLDNTLGAGPTRDSFRGKARRLMQPVFARIGWTARPGEGPAVAQLRETLIPALGLFGDEATVAAAARYAQASFDRPETVPGSIRQPALSIYAYNADRARWDALRARAKTERSPVARNQLYGYLGAVRDPALAQAALDLTLTDEIPVPVRASVIRAVAGEHPALAFDFAIANQAKIDSFLEASTRAAYIPALPGAASDPALADRVIAFGNRPEQAGSRKPAETTAAAIRTRAAIRARFAPVLAAWAAR